MNSQRFSRSAAGRAFTLVELLVVIGLIAALAGGLGLALRGGDRALALRSAQSTLASLSAAARSHAALMGRNAALLVQADPDRPEGYLRRFAVASRHPVDDTWILTGDWVTLPPGVAILPPVVPTGVWVTTGSDWTGLRSTAFPAAPDLCDGVRCLVLKYTPRGTVGSFGGAIVLAPAVAQPATAETPFRYEQPEAVRGLTISSYGLVTFIHERSGFQAP